MLHFFKIWQLKGCLGSDYSSGHGLYSPCYIIWGKVKFPRAVSDDFVSWFSQVITLGFSLCRCHIALRASIRGHQRIPNTITPPSPPPWFGTSGPPEGRPLHSYRNFITPSWFRISRKRGGRGYWIGILRSCSLSHCNKSMWQWDCTVGKELHIRLLTFVGK